MDHALALLEYGSLAAGIEAVDRMLKRSPVAVLRCGSVHPGRWLALVGGTVASTEEAHREGVAFGTAGGSLVDEVCLADPHPALAAAVAGGRSAPAGEAVGVLETSSSPTLLRAVDAALKAVAVHLVEVRLADDLGGRALAIVDGSLTDVQAALDEAEGIAARRRVAAASSLLARVDDTLRRILADGSRFASCPPWQPEGAELIGEGACISDA